MANESTTPTGGSAVPGQQPQPGASSATPPAQQPAAHGADDPTTDTTIQNPEAAKYAAEAAKHRAALRETQAKLAEYEKREKDAADAQLSELEKAKKRAGELEAEVAAAKSASQATILRLSIQAQAAQLDFVDPADAHALLDQAEIKYGDDGAPTNLEKLLRDLAAAKPYLLKAGHAAPAAPAPRAPTAGGATSPARSAAPMPGQPFTKPSLMDKALWGKKS